MRAEIDPHPLQEIERKRMSWNRDFSRLRNLAKRVGSSRETHQKFFDDQ